MSTCCDKLCASLAQDTCATKYSCADQQSTQCCTLVCYCRWTAPSCIPVTRVSGSLIIMRAWPYLLAFLLLSFVCCCISRRLLMMEQENQTSTTSDNRLLATLDTFSQDTFEHNTRPANLDEIVSTTGCRTRIVRAKLHYNLHIRGKLVKRSHKYAFICRIEMQHVN